METNQFAILHKVVEQLHAVRNGEPWPETLTQNLDSLSYAIALNTGLEGTCGCPDIVKLGCEVDTQCTPMDEAVNGPYLITWERAKNLYDYLPKREEVDLDEERYQQPGESDLSFARRSIDWFELRYNHEDHVAVIQLVGIRYRDHGAWFWMYSFPQRAGYFTEMFPKAWPDEESALAGLRDIGFTSVDELTEADMPRIGFPER